MSFCKCKSTVAQPYQSFPVSGSLAKNPNLNLNDLKKRLINQEDATVYCYVIKSVKNKDNIFQQTGCGPNWQGELITLCTCKHRMRTLFEPENWKGKWIAGFTSINDGTCSKDGGNRRNALVYLMKVEKAFESHQDLWSALTAKARIAKDANKEGNIHGDVFHPRRRLKNGDKYNPSKYKGPCKSHVHSECWHGDVNYSNKTKKRFPSLLVGDKKNSFLWDKPHIVIAASFGLYRNHKKKSLE
jgi:hypothetical protein